MKSLGHHALIELYDCDSIAINDVDYVSCVLDESARVAGATVIKTVFHKFNPHGVSGVVVIAESHFSIHTWPEYGYCAVDVFTCGEVIDNQKAISYLKEKFCAKSISVIEVKRGVLNLPTKKIKHKPGVEVEV